MVVGIPYKTAIANGLQHNNFTNILQTAQLRTAIKAFKVREPEIFTNEIPRFIDDTPFIIYQAPRKTLEARLDECK